MQNFNVEELLAKYPYFKERSKYTIFLQKDDMERLFASPKILIEGKQVNVEALAMLIENSKYYRYLSKFFNDEIDHVCISNIIRTIQFNNKIHIITALEKIIEDDEIKISKKVIKRYRKLKRKVSYTSFLIKYHKVNCNIEIDKIKYVIPFEHILTIMTMKDEQFDEICSNDSIEIINGIPKEHLIYAAYIFFIANKIFKNYEIPENITSRFNDIDSFQKIDIEAINKHVITCDFKHKEISLNKELKEEILSGMPKGASNLEKAIYIYIKMCKIFTYDDEFYVMNQSGVPAEKHRNIEHVSQISLTNNKIVCFEFNIIYAKLLDELGITFCSTYQDRIGEAYGETHAYLEFRSGKYLARADSTTSIIQGDLSRAKLNQPLVGLVCLNKCAKTQREFTKAVSNMYALLASEEMTRLKFQISENPSSFKHLMAMCQNRQSVTWETSYSLRLALIVRQINRAKVIDIDSLSYVIDLCKTLFSDAERQNNFHIAIVRNYKTGSSKRIAKASMIFTISPLGFSQNPSGTIYYYYDCSKNKIVRLSREKLQSLFDIGTFEYIKTEHPKIPGIKGKTLTKKIKNDRT